MRPLCAVGSDPKYLLVLFTSLQIYHIKINPNHNIIHPSIHPLYHSIFYILSFRSSSLSFIIHPSTSLHQALSILHETIYITPKIVIIFLNQALKQFIRPRGDASTFNLKLITNASFESSFHLSSSNPFHRDSQNSQTYHTLSIFSR